VDRARYDALMEVVRSRMTVRAFDPALAVPHEHYGMILEAARHSPSGANAQPWHFIVVTDAALKARIMEYFREEQVARAKLKMKFPTPDYRGLAGAPGMIVVASDFRWVRAFPVLNDGSELDRMYKDNARVRAWRLSLEPGQAAPPVTQSAPGIRVVVDGGELVESIPGRPARGMAPRSGDFYWQEAGTTRTVRNVGTTRIELVEIELK
jgi:nitroreductase